MEMFQPQLTLCREPDGEYTLLSTTITPNSCYSGGRAVQGAPPNVRLSSEVLPVLLHIHAKNGFCAMALRPVRHRIHNISVAPSKGKTMVTAFVVLNGRIV